MARGVMAIGQFACGGICISQFGVYVTEGTGQLVISLQQLLAMLFS